MEEGALRQRCWFLSAEPTADALDFRSAFALEEQGQISWRNYAQIGPLQLLTPDMARPDVGESGPDLFVNPGPMEAAEAWMAHRRDAASVAESSSAGR